MSDNIEKRDSDDDVWTGQLGAMIRELPAEREPGRLLEERTVAALREHGLLRAKPARRMSTARLAGAIAASIAIFATGVVAGQWLGTRSTATAFASAQSDALLNALQVQHAGSAYVNALQALVQATDSADAQANAQGREVALAAFHAAANEMVRLVPSDPVSTEILRGLQRVRQQAQPEKQSTDRNIIWY